MLTLKEPIKLNIDDGFLTVSEGLYERMAGNYSMMTARISPKELLFYLTAPPEFPEELFGMTSIAVQNKVSDNRSIGIELINNFINRILLSQTDSFTYQDEVYIENLLRGLGIRDVSLFMKQVQKLASEQLSIRELISLYEREMRLREALPPRGEETEKKEALPPEGRDPESSVFRYYLHSDIYRRLETAAVYDIVNSFQQDQSRFFGSFHKNELKTAEQLSVSNLLFLSGLREKAAPGQSLYLRHSVNHFELGDLSPVPENEGEVLSQAAAACLVSLVESLLVQQITRKGELKKAWLSLQNALSETVQNSIARFQSYHSGDMIYLHKDADLSLEMESLYKSEAGILQELISIREQLLFSASSPSFFPATEGAAAALEHFILSSQSFQFDGDSAFYYDEHGNIIVKDVETGPQHEGKTVFPPQTDAIFPLLPPEHTESGGAAQGPLQPSRMEHPEGESVKPEPLEESPTSGGRDASVAPGQIAELARRALGHAFAPPAPMVKAPASSVSGTPSEHVKALREAQLQSDLRAGRELLREVLLIGRQDLISPAEAEDASAAFPLPPRFEALRPLLEKTVLRDSYSKLRETLLKAGESGAVPSYPEALPPEASPAKSFAESEILPSETVFAQPMSDSEAPAELIARELSEINRRNRERFEAVQAVRAEKIASSIPVPDAEKTMSGALRALESPEAVLRELIHAPAGAEPAPSSLSPEARAFLDGADPATRQIAEAVLRYEKNPGLGIGSGLLKPASEGEFNAATALHPAYPEKSESVDEPASLTRETARFTERTDTVLEHYSRSQETGRAPFMVTEMPPKVPIVHKIEQSQYSEELLEQLRQEQKRKAVETSVSESVSHSEIHETEHETVNRQVVAQTTQDITELVNRTLAKQMNAISDKVYRQMEKRLQTERSRRGRF